MADNIHPVVKLLAARMESHPEEFGLRSTGRWDMFLTELQPLLTDAEKLLLRPVLIDELHRQVMDELFNGEDRRRQLEAQREKEQIALKQAQTIQVQRALAQAQTNAMNHAQSVISANTSSIQSNKLTLDEDALTRIKKYLGL